MIFVAVLILGQIALDRLPTNLFPDIRSPRVTTTVRTTGLSPTEVERRICETLERQMYTLRGVTQVETIARADSAVVITEFTWDTPLDFAFLDVKKAVADLQRTRSTEISSVSVLRYDPNARPVMTVALVTDGESTLEDLRRLADQTLRPRFERLPGVASIVITGGDESEVRISLDESLLLQYELDVAGVVSALQQENVNSTGGYITEGTRRFLLRAIGEFRTADEIRRVVVKRQGEAPVLLEDVAQIEVVPKDPVGMVLYNGKPAVGLSFYREAEGNTVGVARAIREELDIINGVTAKPGSPAHPGMAQGPGGGMMTAAGSAQPGILPPQTRLEVVADQSDFIVAAIEEVRSNALMGGLLAVLVLLLFLRDIRTTIIISIAIPVSIVATFNLMFFSGLTLNLMTLGGLALGVGMLVDNAIVVLENIFRKRQEGCDADTAAREGSREVSGAIIAATLTTVVVFVPIIYVQGVAGLIFKEQALTVSYSLLASLIVALLLIPMLAARFLGKQTKSLMLDAVADGALQVPRTWYTFLLGAALRMRLLVVAIAVASLFLAWEGFRGIRQEFLPRTEQKQIDVRLVLPNGTPIESTKRVAETILGRASELGADADPKVSLTYARVGESPGIVDTQTEDPDGPNTADLVIRLADAKPGQPPVRSSEIIAALRPEVDRLPDAKVEFRTGQGTLIDLLGTSPAPLLIEISGAELEVLTLLASEIQARLQDQPGLLNVRTNILEGSPEVHVTLDKVQLGRLGFDIQSVANTIRRRIEGEDAGQIKHDTGDVDIRVRVDYGREDLDVLGGIVLRSPGGALVPLRSVADFRIERGPREIVRRHQERVARVMADLQGVKLSDAIAEASSRIESLRMPAGYMLRFTGEEEQRAEAFERLQFALLLSIVLVYMVMASIFESFLQPLLIMVTIPLAAVGIVAAFLATDQTINVMALIGVIMLGGIVVNNAIVLLDCVNQVRRDAESAGQELSARDSLLIGCERRLRPVFMTTATTVLGLLPLAMGFGEGAELRQAMAVAVLGGLLSSTVLTLLIIPVAQSYLDSATAVVRRFWSRRRSRSKSVETALP